jgi:hypothetical protein
MKLLSVVNVLSFLFILNLFLITTVDATVTKEYLYDHHDIYGNKKYSLKLKVIIETEEDGSWIIGKNYTVDYIITLTFLNHSVYDPTKFYLNISSYGLISSSSYMQISTGYRYNISCVINSIRPTSSLQFKVFAFKGPSSEYEKVRMKPVLFIKYNTVKHGWWMGEEPIYIQVKRQIREPSLMMPFIYIAAGIIFGILIGFSGAYIIYKKRKIV